MLTPTEIKNYQFSSVTSDTVSLKEVRDYLNVIASDYSAMFNENSQLYQRLVACVKRIEEYQQDEQLLRDAQTTAKDLADKIIKNTTDKANLKAKKIEEDNELKIKKIEDDTALKIQNIQVSMQQTLDLAIETQEKANCIIKELNENISAFKNRIIEEYRTQISSLKSSEETLPLIEIVKPSATNI